MQKRTKAIGETLTFQFEFARALEATWEPGVEYADNVFVRPPVPNGFEYEATSGGQSAQNEPDWPTVIESPPLSVVDGSIEWTVRDFSTGALDGINTHQVTAETGITVGSTVISGTRVMVPLSGGTVGKCYDVTCKVTTLSNEIYTEVLRVTVTE